MSTSPDAELVALCARFIALEDRLHGRPRPDTIAAEHAREAADRPLREEEARLVLEIARLRATTLAGHQARARAILAFGLVDFTRGEPAIPAFGDDDAPLVIALLRDLAAEASAPAIPAHP